MTRKRAVVFEVLEWGAVRFMRLEQIDRRVGVGDAPGRVSAGRGAGSICAR